MPVLSPAFLPTPQLEADRVSILLVDPDADRYLPSLRSRFEVSAVSSEHQAMRALRAFQPTLVVTELALPDGDGVSVCRRSKAFAVNPPAVLVTTALPERVPDALLEGCDAILLKPFAPNLLHTRIGRLLRQRAKVLQHRNLWQAAGTACRIEHAHLALTGTNIVCKDASCPSCGQGGAINFDSAGLHRMWYACLPCRKVWLGLKRSA
jgi:DNA-binding response OmpR family regulator